MLESSIGKNSIDYVCEVFEVVAWINFYKVCFLISCLWLKLTENKAKCNAEYRSIKIFMVAVLQRKHVKIGCRLFYLLIFIL